MTKHYSPVTNNIESCVGQDRCKYGDNELAVHFEDHEIEESEKYMEETNRKVFGLFPDSNTHVAKTNAESEFQAFVNDGELGPYHTVEHLSELEKYKKEYDYGEALSNAKHYLDQTKKDFKTAKYRHNEYAEGASNKAFDNMLESYAYMMGNFYATDRSSPDAIAYHKFFEDEIPKAIETQKKFIEKEEEFYDAEEKFLKHENKNANLIPRAYKPPLFFW